MAKFVLDIEENIIEKGDNVGCQYFLFLTKCFSNCFKGLW